MRSLYKKIYIFITSTQINTKGGNLKNGLLNKLGYITQKNIVFCDTQLLWSISDDDLSRRLKSLVALS